MNEESIEKSRDAFKAKQKSQHITKVDKVATPENDNINLPPPTPQKHKSYKKASAEYLEDVAAGRVDSLYTK